MESSFRQRAFQLLDHEQVGLARLVNGSIIFLIVLTLIVLFIETVPGIQKQYEPWFNAFEYISIGLFTIEYFARVWASAELNSRHPWKSRWQHITSLVAIIDLLAILPFYLGLFIYIDTRFLRSVRLLRIIKLTRYSRPLNTLTQVLKNELASITSALCILLILIVIASVAMYLVENKVQPEAFGSIPQAMWWATITLTTVGYGDVVPLTLAGKVLAIIITILGVGIAALPAGIIASGFTSETQRRRDEFQAKVMSLHMINNKLPHNNSHELELLRIKLGLTMKESKSLIHLSTKGHLTADAFKHCPHCGLSLTHKQ